MSAEQSNVVSFPERLLYVERDLRDHSKTITEHNNEIAAIKTARAVEAERDKNTNERFDRIEKAINGIHKLGWWILAAFGASFIGLVANFLGKGGFNL